MVRQDRSVQLHQNGEYWRLRYIDQSGVRQTKSIGSKRHLSRSDAERQREELAKALSQRGQHSQPPANRGRLPKRRDSSAPAIAAFIDEYFADLGGERCAPATFEVRKLVTRSLLSWFGPEMAIDKITDRDAIRWQSWMAAQKDEKRLAASGLALPGCGLAASTVAFRTILVKAIFKQAVKPCRYLSESPFTDLRCRVPRVTKPWQELTWEQIENLEKAAEEHSLALRNLVSVTARAGLRCGEALLLRKDQVDFARNKIRASNEKTASRTGHLTREVLLEPELAATLKRTLPLIEGEFVCPVDESNLHRTMAGYHDKTRNKRYIGVIEKAGIPPYAKPFHTLRKNRSTTWKLRYPEMIVDKWLGHGPEVARRHYNQVPESFYKGAPEATERTVGLAPSQVLVSGASSALTLVSTAIGSHWVSSSASMTVSMPPIMAESTKVTHFQGGHPQPPSLPASPDTQADSARSLDEELLNAQQAADLLGVCKPVVYKLCNEKLLPHYRLWNTRILRFSRKHLNAWLESSLVTPRVPKSTTPSKKVADSLFDTAVELVLEAQSASGELLQRRLRIGRRRSCWLIDRMEEAGIISGHKGSMPRDVLITADSWKTMRPTCDMTKGSARRW